MPDRTAHPGAEPAYSVVVPTVGRPELPRALRPLLAGADPAPAEIVVVDDRPAPGPPPPGTGHPAVRVLRSGGRGPACARDLGWRATRAPWVVFLDDDVVPDPDWCAALAADLAGAGDHVGGVQGRIEVPPPPGRRPTDAERGTLGLAGAAWITADMAYRRSALEAVDGFDRRFRRAYREDTDIALRVLDAGFTLVRGRRRCVHPVRDAGLWRSVAAQAGNADDVLMRRLHGRGWRDRVAEPPGRFRRHVAATAALGGAVAAGALAAAASSAADRRAAARRAADRRAHTAGLAVALLLLRSVSRTAALTAAATHPAARTTPRRAAGTAATAPAALAAPLILVLAAAALLLRPRRSPADADPAQAPTARRPLTGTRSAGRAAGAAASPRGRPVPGNRTARAAAALSVRALPAPAAAAAAAAAA
ncbi:glycosyltransferase family 2 protein, partial [Streptomonospora mangrovi]|uniref:glycosyltransferase family 2 protein n=1 Tax=Streptomonospora mangrovi TaxID=2883123 RepID=UPI0022DD4C23